MGVRPDAPTIETIIQLTFYKIIKIGPVILAIIPPDSTLQFFSRSLHPISSPLPFPPF